MQVMQEIHTHTEEKKIDKKAENTHLNNINLDIMELGVKHIA